MPLSHPILHILLVGRYPGIPIVYWLMYVPSLTSRTLPGKRSKKHPIPCHGEEDHLPGWAVQQKLGGF